MCEAALQYRGMLRELTVPLSSEAIVCKRYERQQIEHCLHANPHEAAPKNLVSAAHGGRNTAVTPAMLSFFSCYNPVVQQKVSMLYPVRGKQGLMGSSAV